MTARRTPHSAGVATVVTPAGPFTVVASDAGDVLASGWTDDPDALLGLIAPPLRPDDLTATVPTRVLDAVRRYHAGELTAIDDVVVRQHSGPFLTEAWAALRRVPAGHPVTYTELAAAAGAPRAIRAAGSACARNAAALFVPCHRVVPAGGGVGGFRWGPTVKRWLLDHEAA